MVAIVTGNGLGLQSSSALGLGGRGQVGNAGFGKSGEQVYVNAASGNLILRDRDQWLLGRGVDAELYRAYNSQAQLLGEAWRSGTSKQVGSLTGTLNTVGSTVQRTDWDGSRVVYAWDAARSLYVATTGAGTRDTLVMDESSQWRWTQGDGALKEYYSPLESGSIVRSVDRDGNETFYFYGLGTLDGPSKLTEIRTASGESTQLEYDGELRLTSVRTLTQAGSSTQTSTAVRYSYDSLGRLSTVTLDLSPDDNSVADGKVFTTTYGYDGNSARVASIAQSDGSRVAFTYQQVGGDYRVATIAQTSDTGILRTTSLSYDLANCRTVITDPLGLDTILSYDEQGRLLQTSSPAVNGTRQTQSFTYNAAGQVATVRDGLNNEVKYSYDAAGNLTKQEDAVGTVVDRTYGANNQLLSETVSGPNTAATTTHYVYDAEQHLRFKVSAEGRVTEFRYNAAGQQVAMLTYSVGTYSGSDKSEAAVASWVGAQARIGERTDTAYDFRGNVISVTKYGTLRADGSGLIDDKTLQSRFVYDAQGRLLQRYVGAIANPEVEQFSYDGLGRVTATTAFNDSITLTQYDDAQRRTIVTFSNGLVRTSTYNHAGELIAVAESGNATVLSQVKYAYDANGRLRMTEDALGAKTHVLYDEAGRRAGEIDATGALTEYQYDANNQVTKITRYANAVGAAALAGLVDGNGKPRETATVNGASVALTLANAGVKPAADAANDRPEWRFYDGAGRLIKTVNAVGAVIDYTYNAKSQLIKTFEYWYTVNLTTFAANPTIDNAKPAANHGSEHFNRYFYRDDGLLQATLTRDGRFVENAYDAAGHLVQTSESYLTINYQVRLNGTLDQVRPMATAADKKKYYQYDSRGLLVLEVDGEGYVSRYDYDSVGNVSRLTRGEKIPPGSLYAPKSATGSIKVRGVPASSGSYPSIEVWIDGSLAKSVQTSAVETTFDFSALVLPGVDHQIAFVYDSKGGGEASITSATFAGVALADVGAITWDRGGTLQAAGTPESRPAGAQNLVENGVLRWRMSATQTVSLVSTTPGVIERTDYQYDVDGRILSQTELAASGNTVTSYGYDSQGQVVSKRRSDRAANYRYDLQGRLVAELAGRGSKELETLGAGASSSDIENVWVQWGIRYNYDAAGRRTSMVDGLGRRTLFYYDTLGRLTHAINAQGEVSERRYNGFGDLAETLVYAKRLSALAVSQMEGGATTQGVRDTVALLDGPETSRAKYEYTTIGQIKREIDAVGAWKEYTYHPYGELNHTVSWSDTARTSGSWIQQSIFVDYAGRPTVTYDANRNSSSIVYDGIGRVSTVATSVAVGSSSQRKTNYGYDRNNRLVSEWIVGDPAAATFTYDAFGNKLTHKDRVGNTISYSYAAFGREVVTTSPEGVVTTRRFNEHGQVSEVVDGRGQKTTYEYDLDGLLLRVTDPAGTSTTAYDRVGQVIESVDANGNKTVFEYDPVGRVVKRLVDPNGLAITTTYEYDAKGQQVRSTDPTGMVTEVTYDLNGRKIKVTVDAGEGRLNLVTMHEYDALGRVVKITEGVGTAAARVTAYAYDKAGRVLSTTVDPQGLALKTSYVYDGPGNVVARTDANGATARYVYDHAERLTHTIDAVGGVQVTSYDADGRVAAVVRYATKIDVAGLPMQASAADIASRLQANAAIDNANRFVYDRDGRQRYSIDSLGYVTEQVYDNGGNVVRRVGYATAIAASVQANVPSVSAALLAQGAQAHAADRTSHMVYDPAGRLIFEIDGGRYVVRNRYDANGNLLSRIRYAVAYPAASAVGSTELAAWAAQYEVSAPYPTVSEQKFAYDRAGRLTWEVDAAGGITRHIYDASGRRIKITRFQGVLSWPELKFGRPDLFTDEILAGWAQNHTYQNPSTTWFYDAAGRQLYEFDAGGYFTEFGYDAVGNRTRSVRYNKYWFQFTTEFNERDSAEKIRGILTGLPGAISTYKYDGAGRLVEMTDAMGGVKHYQRDGLGRVLSEFVAWGTVEQVEVRFRYDAEGRLIEETRGAGTSVASTTRHAYDAFGQRTSSTDPRGVELIEQDSQWALAQRLALGYINETGAVLRAADLTGVQKEELLARYTSRSVYDRAGRMLQSIDAAGAVVSRSYNAFGNAIEMADALGKVGYFYFDALGRTTHQVDPEGYLTKTEYDYLGNAINVRRYAGKVPGAIPQAMPPAVPAGSYAETKMTYNNRGLLTQVVDAEGAIEKYGYDQYDRLTLYTNKLGAMTVHTRDALGRTTSEAVGVVELYGVTTQFQYDAHGNVLRRFDASGSPEARTTTFTYDALNRKTSSVETVATGNTTTVIAKETFKYDARGNLIEKIGANNARTVYYYDANNRLSGQVDPNGLLTVNSYDDAGNLIKALTYEQPTALPAGWAIPPPPTGPIREKQFQYDANNRLIKSVIVGAQYVKEEGKGDKYGVVPDGRIEESWEYDLGGRLIRHLDANKYLSHTFYDALGQKRFEIDADGYATKWNRDAEGNVLEERRYATAKAGPFDPAQIESLITAWPINEHDDRITVYSYDKMGRRLSESRLGVIYGAVDSNGQLSAGLSGSATTAYAYDAAGNLLRRADANGNVFGWEYDKLGRNTAVILPGMTDYAGRSVIARTEYTYNRLNQIVKEVRRGLSSTEDQATTYVYGAGGRLLSKTNSLGYTTQFGYDAAGNMTRMSYLRTDSAGGQRTETIEVSYDISNRETQRVTVGNDGSRSAERRTRYNLLGDVTGRGTGASGWQEFADYDLAGRMSCSNMQGGITKRFIYDGNGNAAIEIESQVKNLRSLSFSALMSDEGNSHTLTFYNGRNQVVDVVQASMSAEGERLGLRPFEVPPVRPGQIQTTVGGKLGGDPIPPNLGEVDGSLTLAGGGGTLATIINSARLTSSGAHGVVPDTMEFRLELPDYTDVFGSDYAVRIEVEGEEIYWVGNAPDLGGASGAFNGQFVGTQADRVAIVSMTSAFPDGGFRSSDGQINGRAQFAVRVFVTPRASGGGRELLIAEGSEQNLKAQGSWTGMGFVFSQPRSTFVVLDPSVPPEFSGDAIQMPIDAFRSDVSPQVYVRPWGSSEAYSLLPVQRSAEQGKATVDVAGLADGQYELLYLSEQDDGALVRREQYQLQVGSGQSIARIADTGSDAYRANGLGTFVWSGTDLHLATLRSRDGGIASSATVEYRRKGSQDPWVGTAPLDGLPPQTTPGSFRFNTAGLSGDYEVWLTMRDAQGGVAERIKGEITVGTTPRVSLDYAHDADVIRFANLPPNAATMSLILQRPDGSTAATMPATAIVDGALVWSMPPELMAEAGAGVKAYALIATFTDNLTVPSKAYVARGSVQIGPQRLPSSVVKLDDHLYTLSLDPGLSEAQVVVVHYRPEGNTETVFKEVIVLRGPDGKFEWDSLGLDPKLTYEYYYDAFRTLEDAQNPSDGLRLIRIDGYFWADVAQPANEARWVYEVPQASDRVIHRKQTYNAFGEIASETDGNDGTTTLSYNTLGKLVRKTDPKVRVTRANGYREEIAPFTEYYYDLAGSVVGYRDANGNLTTQAWNYGTAQPTLKTEWHADGGFKQFGVDVFGNQRVSIDEVGRRTDYTYDAGNRLVRLDRPVLASGERAWETYGYDELDHRIRHGNVLGTDTTDFSIEGEVSRVVSAAGRTTSYSATWDAAANDGEGAWRRVMTNANGKSLIDWVTAQGRKLSHTNLAEVTFAYEYNQAGLLVSSGLAGQTERQTRYEYYRNGLLKRMTDTASGIKGYYEYDKNGNRTFEGFTGKNGGWAFQQSVGEYDALNRLTKIYDPRYEINYEYDAQGNRIHMKSVYKDGINGATAVQDYWYAYDSMNRFIVTMGQYTGGEENRGSSASDTSVGVIVGNEDGVSIAYDEAGQRRLATYGYGVGHTEKYEYDAMGYLTDTIIGDKLRARRVNDLAGRVTEYQEYTDEEVMRSSITHTWDADSLLMQDHDNFTGKGTKTYRMADGTVDYTQTYGEETTLTTRFTYQLFDSAKQTMVRVQPSNKDVDDWAEGFSEYRYDEYGRIKWANDDSGGRTFVYQVDGEGRILQRDELIGGYKNANGDFVNATQNRHHSYYLFDDRQVGNVGNDGIDRIDYAKELAQHEAQAGAKNDQRHKRFTPVAGANFDENYQPINSLYPTAAPGSYIVNAGDTLQSIAAVLWGDAAMWYLLADANGLAPNQPLIANTVLTVPNKVTNIHNNASTFKSYDAGAAMGNTTPTVPEPPPPPSQGKKGCGGFVQILALVVAVIVTIYLGPIAGQYVGSAITGAAIAGAAGSIASQAILIAGGEQKGFDWKGVALGAVAGAVTAGLNTPGMSAGLAKAGVASVWGQAAARAAIGSVATQGAAIALGVQDKFDWKSMAISAVSAGAGEWAGGRIASYGATQGWQGQTIENVSRFGAGMTAGTVSAAASGNLSSGVLLQAGLNAIVATIGTSIAERQLGKNGFSTRYPNSQASIANSDVSRSDSIDVGRMSALLGQRDAITLDPVIVTADQAMYDITRETFPIQSGGLWYGGNAIYNRESGSSVGRSNGSEFASVIAAATSLPSSYGMRAMRRDPTVVWDVAVDTINSYGSRFANWYSGTSFGGSGVGQRMLGQTRQLPHWNADGIRRAVLPTVTEWGERGKSGSWFDYQIGKGKAAVNLARDLTQMVINVTPALGLQRSLMAGAEIPQLPRFEYSDRELFGAAELEFAAAVAPELSVLGRTSGALRVSTGFTRDHVGDASGNFTAAAFREGKYLHDIVPRTNLEIYGEAISRTPSEAKEILVKIGHDPDVLDGYNFVKLTDSEYETMVRARGGKHFDAAYGTVPNGAKSVSFGGNIASRMANGELKVPVWVRSQVFESDEAIAQVLSHEIYEVESLRYELHSPVSVNVYAERVASDVYGNLHYEAVREGDAMLLKLRQTLNGG